MQSASGGVVVHVSLHATPGWTLAESTWRGRIVTFILVNSCILCGCQTWSPVAVIKWYDCIAYIVCCLVAIPATPAHFLTQ